MQPVQARQKEQGSQQQQQQQQQQQEQQPEEPQFGSCFETFDWIQPALHTFYKHAWVAANGSTQSTEEALQALRAVMWGK
jgi:hypothetical protein